jgi:methyl-accepting chemotaxis protein
MALKQSTIIRSAAATFLLLTALLAGAVFFNARTFEALTEAHEQQRTFIEIGQDVADASDYLTNEVRRYVVTQDARYLDNYWREIEVTRTRDRALERLSELGATERELGLLAEAVRNSDALVETETRGMRLVLEAKGIPAHQMPAAIGAYDLSTDAELSAEDKVGLASVIMFDDLYESHKQRIAEPIEAFRNLIEVRGQAAVDEAQDRQQTAQLILLLLVLLIPTGLGLMLRLVHTQLSRPVVRFTGVLRGRDANDFSATLTPEGTEELRELAESFNDMIDATGQAFNVVNVEKASVQQKVDKAVAEAEAKRAYLSRSVERMLQVMERFAEGDLTVTLSADRQDEIGQLFDGFNRALRNMQEMLRQVGAVVGATASASTKISASTDQLASSAQEQSAQAGEVAAAVEQMVRTIVDNSRSATRAAEVAEASGRHAKDGGDIVRQTLEKIRQIASVVSDSTQTVEQLGVSSQQIGEIVSVIDDIADQTNLLALNAAIEAARAGDQGRGFAVVADEVRKLAERTTGATREIAQMIKTIQVETGQAVESMKRGNAEVGLGIDLADQAGRALERIVTGAESTVDVVMQIAAASEEQSSTSEQISRAVEMISTVSGESAHGVAQIAQSAEDLNRLTVDLRQLVERFRLQDGSNRDLHRTATVEAPQHSVVDGAYVSRRRSLASTSRV